MTNKIIITLSLMLALCFTFIFTASFASTISCPAGQKLVTTSGDINRTSTVSCQPIAGQTASTSCPTGTTKQINGTCATTPKPCQSGYTRFGLSGNCVKNSDIPTAPGEGCDNTKGACPG